MKQVSKLLLVTAVILTCILSINSCKKTEDAPSPDTQTERELVMKKLSIQINQHPELRSVTFPLNAKAECYFGDDNGDKIDLNNSANFTYQCADPADIYWPPTASITTLVRDYNCNQGYRFTATWIISAPVYIVGASPFGGAATVGRFKIINTAGSTVLQNLNITPVSIVDLGDDPSTGNNNKRFQLTYTTQWIPFSYFNGMNTLYHSVVGRTDCIDAPSVVATYSWASSTDASNPCNRIDPVAINWAEMNGSTYISNGSLMGFGNILSTGYCPNPPSGTYPNRHEVQLKCVVAGVTDSWRNITPKYGSWPGNITTDGNLDPFSAPSQNGTIGLNDAYYIPNRDLYPVDNINGNEVHGNYKVRYRNKMNNGCVGQWSAEFDAIF